MSYLHNNTFRVQILNIHLYIMLIYISNNTHLYLQYEIYISDIILNSKSYTKINTQSKMQTNLNKFPFID